MTFYIDGHPRPKEPEREVKLLDPDLFHAPRPIVIEHDGMQPFYAAGGWVRTTPGELPTGDAQPVQTSPQTS